MGHSRYVAVPSPLSSALFGALGADAFDHVVDGLGLEAVGQCDCRNGDLLKAEGAVADLTVEMDVAVVIDIAVCVAEFVSDPFTAVINLMQQVVLIEQGQSAEYAGLVNGVNGVLKLGHGDGTVALGQRLEYQQTVRCGLDTVLIQNPFQFFHSNCEVTQKKV